MPMVHVVSSAYDDPRFETPTVNHTRVYGGSADAAVELMRRHAPSFVRVELAWSESISEAELREFNAACEVWQRGQAAIQKFLACGTMRNPGKGYA